MNNKRENVNIFVTLMLLLSIVSLFVENGLYQTRFTRLFTNTLDYIIFLLFVLEIATGFIKAKYRFIYLRQNLFEVAFLFIFATLFIYTKYVGFLIDSQRLKNLSKYVIIIRNLFIFIKVFARVKKFNALIHRIAGHPARTIVFSFVIVIITGTLFLMMPFSTSDITRLGFVDSLFTATSAVCVTGLIVVDTATRFSMIGKIVILVLIQIGGLGIMILSYFTMFLFGRKVSVERKLIMSYMLNEQDMTSLFSSVKGIIRTTFFIELWGFLLLAVSFSSISGIGFRTLFSALFHSVSAFCNAGFSLFTDNLAGFASNSLVNFTIAFLIILGGLGFSVLSNLFVSGKKTMVRIFTMKRERVPSLSLNTRAVLLTTVILVMSGTFIIYAFEHGNTLINYPIGSQYLAAFFQSVTLRTAGFNTIDFTLLNRFTYLFMMLYMFIGGASGSTAGGVKVNTVALIGGYINSTIRNRDEVTLFNQSISNETINKAFFIVFLYSTLLFIGAVALAITENLGTVPILFEVVSAMGTVGLSAGITSSLSHAGKVVIILLMFIGRVGPLTIFVALSQRKKHFPVSYPQGHIAIG